LTSDQEALDCVARKTEYRKRSHVAVGITRATAVEILVAVDRAEVSLTRGEGRSITTWIHLGRESGSTDIATVWWRASLGVAEYSPGFPARLPGLRTLAASD
jgi:hypothetical protein